MQHLKNLLPQNLATTGPEEWILTKEEERIAMAYAVLQKAKLYKHPTEEDRVAKAIEFYSEEEKKKYLTQCNANKHYENWQTEKRENRRLKKIESQNALIKKCDANYFYNLIKRNAINSGKDFLFNEQTKNYISSLCFFFSNDKRFTGDINKGLWIRGLTGRGKTFPLQCLQNNELKPFKIHSMLQVVQDVAADGEYEIYEPLKVLDDVGSEQSVVNHYGTKINWFKDFIEMYYSKQQPFNRLIITTNFDFNEVEKNYGFRVRSRIKEMFNIIDLLGEDLRK